MYVQLTKKYLSGQERRGLFSPELWSERGTGHWGGAGPDEKTTLTWIPG